MKYFWIDDIKIETWYRIQILIFPDFPDIMWIKKWKYTKWFSSIKSEQIFIILKESW